MITRSKSILNIFTLFALLASLIGSALIVTPARAAAFIVTKDTDTNDGTCDGDCSLREAITAANANGAGSDTITFAANYTITLGSQLDVTTTIIINGNSAVNTIIQANASPNTATYRVFEVDVTGNLTLDSLTVRHGRCTGECVSFSKEGGGIYNNGTLTVTNSALSSNFSRERGGGIYNNIGKTLTVSNSAFSGNYARDGAGIFNYDGILSMTNSTFSGNSALFYGGGLSNTNAVVGQVTITSSIFSNNSGGGSGAIDNLFGTLSIANSTFSNNTATTEAGGAIDNLYGTLSITNSTFTNNTATNVYGGGLSNNHGTLTITNSTFSDNIAFNRAGAIDNHSGTLSITNSTFSNNTATAVDSVGGGIANSAGQITITNSTFSDNNATLGNGGAIFSEGVLATLNLYNTILANSATGDDCYNLSGTVTGNNNLIETDAGGGNACGTTAPINNNDPQLGTLSGLPAYFPLNPGSPAMGAGDNTICAAAPVNNTSQNGITRPKGANCDIGSYEYPAALTVTKVADTNDGTCNAADCSLREAIAAASSGDTITFVLSLAGQTIRLASTLSIDKSLTIDGSGLNPHVTISGDTNNDGLTTPNVEVFYIYNSGGLINVELNHLDIVEAGAGGGVNILGENVTVKNSTFSDNTDSGIHGLRDESAGSLTVLNSTFINNTAPSGGGIYSNDLLLMVANSTFSGNSSTGATGGGGGLSVYNQNSGAASIINTTISQNAANGGGVGGGITKDGNLALNLKNTIIESSTGVDCYLFGGSISYTQTIVRTTGAGVNSCGTPTSTADPLLLGPGYYGGMTQTYYLANNTSPAYNTGDTATCNASPVNALDQRGVDRPQYGACDMGSYELDNTSPTVINVTSTTPDGSYNTGDTIAISIAFSEIVNVTGTPQLTLETGTADQIIDYASGTGTATLTFNYSVQVGDTSSDLDYVATNSLGLNGGAIKDAALNNSILTLAAPGAAGSLGANKGIVIDTTAPTVTNVTSTTPDGIYKTGDTIAITVTFSEIVNVTGAPQLTLDTGTASYVDGTGTTILTFNYTVQAGDTSSDLDYDATNSLYGGTIKDRATNNAVRTLAVPGAPFSLGANKDIVIDGIPPMVTDVTSTTSNGSYKAGTVIAVTVIFSEIVNVTGMPQLTLETGTTDRIVDYASGTGTATLTFNYTVLAGDTSNDLDYVATTSLDSNTGTINDAALNDADLTLAAPADPGSLGANKNIVIDTTTPTVTNVTSTASDGTYKIGDTIAVTVIFDEIVNVTSTPQLTLETGAADQSVNYAIGTGTTTLTFNYTVQAGDISSDLDYVATTSLGLNSGAIKDVALNDAVLTLAVPGIAGSLGANKNIMIDGVAPETQIDSNPPNPSNSASATFTFSSTDVTVTVFECSIDGGAYTGCTNPVNYSSLAEGSHTFGVRAKDPAGNVDATPASYTWTLDAVAPTVVSSLLVSATPTNLANVDFTVTFSESVTGVDLGDFSLTTTGVSGAFVSGVSGSGSVYTVTVNTGSGNGTIRLNLPASATITDLVGKPLANLPYITGEVYTIIRTYNLFLPLILR